MSLKINLYNHSDKFMEDSKELIFEKKINFIFGKNGTGKTTITNEIESQLSGNYEVCIFKDFDGVAENDRLNAIALGTENVAIQEDINAIDAEISEITKHTEKPVNKNEDNYFTRAEKAKKAYCDQERKINNFYTSAARDIKSISNPQIVEYTFDTRGFQKDIVKACELSDDVISTYKNIIKSDRKPDVNPVVFPEFDLSTYISLVNEILQSSVSQTQDIPELQGNAKKQDFARQGMAIHEHKAGEECAFCGNVISEERWRLLGNYFNDKVKELEQGINDALRIIETRLEQIHDIKELKDTYFYDKFSDDIRNLNFQIQARRNECKEYLTQLKVALEEKRKNLFNKVEPLGVKIPEDFSNIKKLCQTLVEEHNNLSQNLKNEQSNAQNALRYHEVRKQLNVFKHEEEKGKLSTLKAISDKAQNELKNKQDELKVKQDERKNLILKTKDEEKMAIEINRLLGNMGVLSFSLKLVDNDKEDQRGQYQIKGHDGRIRPITQLSKGEKNIIAFLYFMLSLKRADSNIKPRVIVLDDPMTSNDDTMQYLIIGEIQRLFRDIKDDNYIIILTHNSHFYLNVRPNTMPSYEKSEMKGLYEKKSFYEKYGVYHLRSSGNFTNIKNIADGKQDFNTSYESLWKELVFLYDADMPDLMLNPCRKICETYLKFTKQDVNIFYGDNRNAKKLFDVNQHSIDDLEAEQNGRTKEEIKSILHDLFKANGAEKHYTVHWKGGGR